MQERINRGCSDRPGKATLLLHLCGQSREVYPLSNANWNRRGGQAVHEVKKRPFLCHLYRFRHRLPVLLHQRQHRQPLLQLRQHGNRRHVYRLYQDRGRRGSGRAERQGVLLLSILPNDKFFPPQGHSLSSVQEQDGTSQLHGRLPLENHCRSRAAVFQQHVLLCHLRLLRGRSLLRSVPLPLNKYV